MINVTVDPIKWNLVFVLKQKPQSCKVGQCIPHFTYPVSFGGVMFRRMDGST